MGDGLTFFLNHNGPYTYISKIVINKQIWTSEGNTVTFTSKGLSIILDEFVNTDVKIIFFGVKN